MDEQIRAEEPSGSDTKKEWGRPEVNELIADVTEFNPGNGPDGGGISASATS